jgi:hypothetical protein
VDKRPPQIRRVKVGAFRIPEVRKSGGDARSELAKRYRQHLKGLEAGDRRDEDPDVEVRQGKPATSPRSSDPARSIGTDFDDDDLD